MKNVQKGEPLPPATSHQNTETSEKAALGNMNGRSAEPLHPATQQKIKESFSAGDVTSRDTDSQKNLHDKKITSTTNRIDKKKSDAPFTQIFMKSVYGQDIAWVELLNTVPKEGLETLKAPQLSGTVYKQKQNSWSPKALESLGLDSENVQNKHQGVILGEGGFGIVKFGRFVDPETGKDVICAVKKIKKGKNESTEVLAERCLREAKLQKDAGTQVSPQIYGYSISENKQGDTIGMIFMEPLSGIRGYDYISKLKTRLIGATTESEQNALYKEMDDIKDSLLTAVESLHDADIFHGDLTSANIFVDKKEKSVKIIDFGEASGDRYRKNNTRKAVCGYAPETVSGRTIDTQKADYFSLGVLILDFLSKDPYQLNPFLYQDDGIDSWTRKDLHDPHALQNIIDNKLDQLTFPNETVKNAVSNLLSVEPDQREFPDDLYGQTHSH